MFVIVLAAMLIATFLTSAQPLMMQESAIIRPSQPVMFDEDVPIWFVGDTWEYEISEFAIKIDEDNQIIDLNLAMDSLPLSVTDVSGGEYTVEFNTGISGDLYAHIEKEGNIYDINGSLVSSTISGLMYYDAATLGLSIITAEIKGLMMLNVKQNGGSLLPFTLPVPATIDLQIDLETPYTFLHFPLNMSCIWGLPSSNLSVDGTIQSIWLNIINFIDTIIVMLAGPENAIIPPDYKHLLPIIDIRQALEEFGFVMPFAIPEIPNVFSCFGNDTITVAGQDYDAYNISMFGGLGAMYYVPEIKNIVKIAGQFEELPYIKKLEMQLKSFDVQ
ncbi:MAG: hypothetical protein KKC68_01040, partial [Candidatus Thermoplasmatota archaeon]|nr:hypothetical protein [Candidatus Thermoplasmatota archaeon]